MVRARIGVSVTVRVQFIRIEVRFSVRFGDWARVWDQCCGKDTG